jgi:hypothetical protein
MARVEPLSPEKLSARALFDDDFDIVQAVAKSFRQPVQDPGDFFSDFVMSQRKAVSIN